jgi:hypothetical protein
MACRVEKLVPVADIALVEGLERRAACNHQMERNLWHTSCVRFFHVSHRRIRFSIWRVGCRPASF